MDWNFSLGWVILGIVILIAGTLVTVYYQPISDNMLSGVSSYDKCKKYGIITAIVGLLIMANLHTLILTIFVNLVFGGMMGK